MAKNENGSCDWRRHVARRSGGSDVYTNKNNKTGSKNKTSGQEEQQLRAQEQQDNLSPGQRTQIENRLNQLRTQQNKLRAKQDQVVCEQAYQRIYLHPSLQISPFTMVRYQGDKVIVTYAGTEYELAAINDIAAPEMLDFCRRQYKDVWQKRFAEDLVVVLADMGHPIGAEHTVSLTLIDPGTGEKKSIERANMTKENRQAINAAFNP